jgi:type I restriction enzyme S subunit
VNFFTNNSSWSLVALKDIATLKRGYDLPTNSRIKGGIPIYAANGRNGTHNEGKLAGPGVITGRSGTIGKVHFTESAYWPLNTALYVTNFHGNDPKWVFYMLKAFKLDRFVQGAGVPTLNRNLVHDELIPLPPLDEQKRIAAILDKADAIRRKRQQAIHLADDFLRSVFLDMFGDPVTNPKGFKKAAITELSDVITGYAFKSAEYVQDSENSVRLCRGANTLTGYFAWKDTAYWDKDKLKGIENYIINPGDVILAMDRPWISSGLKVCVFPENQRATYLVQRVARIRPKQAIQIIYILAFYLLHLKNTVVLQKLLFLIYRQ